MRISGLYVLRFEFPPRTKTFETRADAVAWGRIVESEIERGVFVNQEEAERPRWLPLVR